MPQMGKTEQDWNGLKFRFLKTVQPNSFSNFAPASCKFKKLMLRRDIHLFVSQLWFRNLHIISLVTLSSMAIEGK